MLLHYKNHTLFDFFVLSDDGLPKTYKQLSMYNYKPKSINEYSKDQYISQPVGTTPFMVHFQFL